MKYGMENAARVIDPSGNQNYSFVLQIVKKASENRCGETEHELRVNRGEWGRADGWRRQQEILVTKRWETQPVTTTYKWSSGFAKESVRLSDNSTTEEESGIWE